MFYDVFFRYISYGTLYIYYSLSLRVWEKTLRKCEERWNLSVLKMIMSSFRVVEFTTWILCIGKLIGRACGPGKRAINFELKPRLPAPPPLFVLASLSPSHPPGLNFKSYRLNYNNHGGRRCRHLPQFWTREKTGIYIRLANFKKSLKDRSR